MIYLIVSDNPVKIVKTNDRKQAERIFKSIRSAYPNAFVEMLVAYTIKIANGKTQIKFKKDTS